ncbi:MAG TPA: phage baseplate assembly protein V [Candidatus Baltobacteraceae bacterium]|jgi:uncharacterized protein involved in type VI secretion and phage assembly|nr:phage baseplate assembly protein V [Candidatus Baltobacteraceae bacterium]
MSRMKGVVTGQVVSVDDPNQQGRVQVSLPFLGGQNESYWAPVATFMSGGGRGAWFMPQVGDEVLVAFNQDDPAHPHILGFLWNGQDTPPQTDPRMRVIRSLNGHEIRIYDAETTGGDTGYIRIQYSRGDGAMNIIEVANGGITISSDSAVQILAPNVTINGRIVSASSSPI